MTEILKEKYQQFHFKPYHYYLLYALLIYGGYELYESMYPSNEITYHDFIYQFLEKGRIDSLEIERKKNYSIVWVNGQY